MSLLGKLSLLAGITIIGVVCALELWRWFRGDGILSRGQLARRLVVGFLLQITMGMALLGESLTRTMSPAAQLVYWGLCLIIPMVALMVALREMGIVSRQYARRRAELFHEFTRSQPQDRNPPQPG